jgi:hypothetical protein
MLSTRIGTTTNTLREIKTTDSLYLPAEGSFGQSKVVKKSEVDEFRWNRLVADRQKRLERDLASYQQALSEYKVQLGSWKVQEVLEIDEAKVEYDRQEKQDAVRGKRLERYKDLLKKTLDRIDSTWSNLKQREAKARSQPTAKNFIVVAKAANILYDIYGGTSKKLAEAHPEAIWTAQDVLKDFDRDIIWKHIGTMKGSTYLDPRQSKEIQEYVSHAYTGSQGWGSSFPSLSMYHRDPKNPDVSKDWRPNWPGWGSSKVADRVVARFLAQKNLKLSLRCMCRA